MGSSGFLSSLSLGTLVVAVLVIAVVLLLFLRRRSNRHSMDGRQERNVAADLDKGRDAKDHSPRS